MSDQRQLNTEEWRTYLGELRGRAGDAKDPTGAPPSEEVRALAYFDLDLIARVEELERAVAAIERSLRGNRPP